VDRLLPYFDPSDVLTGPALFLDYRPGKCCADLSILPAADSTCHLCAAFFRLAGGIKELLARLDPTRMVLFASDQDVSGDADAEEPWCDDLLFACRVPLWPHITSYRWVCLLPASPSSDASAASDFGRYGISYSIKAIGESELAELSELFTTVDNTAHFWRHRLAWLNACSPSLVSCRPSLPFCHR
jgi:hypothetical protein